MNGSLARRAALALSAFAFVVSAVSMPATASASVQDQPPARTTPAPLILYPPDIQVTSLGIIKHDHTWSNDGYLFRVKNIGQGPAKKLKMTKQAIIRNESTDAFLREDRFDYVHEPPLNPGHDFLVEVSCTAHGPEYCDLAYVGVVVDQVVKDSNVLNNTALNYDNISGLKQL